MMKSVKERKENSQRFGLCYEDICKLLNRAPLPCVKAHLKKNILDFNGDRITYDEWGPILNALSLDRSLHFIGVRSALCTKKVLEDVTTESQARAVERCPVVQTRFVLLQLMKSLQMCLSNSHALTCMELEGLPLSSDYLQPLIQGVRACVSLQNLSLHRSAVGDAGCEMLCQAIKSLTNIVSIDLSNCGLTDEGALSIAKVIQHQKIQRCSESWKHTLRYREADLDALPGLRRITLNHNTHIQDLGLLDLVDVVKDDLFLKALDMQNCGVGDVGATAVLDMLKSNVSLAIVDLRANQDVNSQLLKEIMQQLHVNNQGCTEKYHWIAVDSLQLFHQPRRAKPRSHSQSPKSPPVRATKSDTPISPTAPHVKRSKSSGVPWRTSERLARRKEHASVCPGTPRSVQLQETEPPFQVTTNTPDPNAQLESARQQIMWISQQLSLEMEKRKQLEKENEVLRRQIREFPGPDIKLVRSSTMAAMEQSLSEFRLLITNLRDMGMNPDTLLHKSYSEHTTRTLPLDVHKTSKSACTVGNFVPVHVETRVGDTLQQEEICSSDSEQIQEEDTNALLYQRILRKNRELHYSTEDDAY
ncbi:hypothetical protein L9F63_024075 [Diploptera punctata]|uniref:Centrosomal protein of 78 kDa n=1 Tax=Diploptera punctata TaxID=6984 RepID=A0AAD7ZHF4_DIPPU|nr:hypothetical protein L9F63_024075 [Diploptera punctata]